MGVMARRPPRLIPATAMSDNNPAPAAPATPAARRAMTDGRAVADGRPAAESYDTRGLNARAAAASQPPIQRIDP